MARIANITFACESPDRLAAFWAAALAYVVETLPPELEAELAAAGLNPGDAAAASDPRGNGPRLFFERKPKSVTDTLPIHLDLQVDDLEQAVAQLESLGAKQMSWRERQIGEFGERWVVMQDPEGNGFCIQAP